MNDERKKNGRILIISPHADDEVIGCGGLIALTSKAGIEVTIVVMATGGVKHCHLQEKATTDNRISELNKSAKRLGVSITKVLFPEKDMNLSTIPELEIVTMLDNVLNECEYDECYIPEPNHNLDHRITYESAMAAMRPGARKYPSMVATYESTNSGWWDRSTIHGQLYINITSVIENKVNALEAYKSQLHPFPHPISIDSVKKLAAFRGMECGVDYAELFKIVRMVKF